MLLENPLSMRLVISFCLSFCYLSFCFIYICYYSFFLSKSLLFFNSLFISISLLHVVHYFFLFRISFFMSICEVLKTVVWTDRLKSVKVQSSIFNWPRNNRSNESIIWNSFILRNNFFRNHCWKRIFLHFLLDTIWTV